MATTTLPFSHPKPGNPQTIEATSMTDIIDIAQQRQLEQIKIQPKDYTAPSLAECEQCGNDIPPQRQAYGGITLCIDCAAAQEAKARTFR